MASGDNPAGVTIRCPGCQQKLLVGAEQIGITFRCSKCGKSLKVKAPAGQENPIAGKLQPPPLLAPLDLPPQPVPAQAEEPRDSLPSKPPAPRRSGPRPSVTHWVMLGFLSVLSAVMVGGAVYSWRMVLDRDRENQLAREAIARGEPSAEKGGGPTGKSGGGEGTKGKAAGAPVAQAVAFPRRALLIAINEYLYANPVQQGYSNPWKGLDKLGKSLQVGLRFPANQVVTWSDAVPGLPVPLKRNLQKTLEDFCTSCRKQDQALVWFTGHACIVGEKAFLAPLDGNLNEEATLIPLAWLFDKLKASPARQKILVLDVYRFNPVIGHERPGSDPMPEAFEKLALAPPDGVEVILACGKGQNSYETEGEPMGVLPFASAEILNSLSTRDLNPDDPIAVSTLVEKINQGVAKDVRAPIPPLAERLESTKRDGKQAEMRVASAGKPVADGAKYDAAEAPPAPPALARPPVENQTGRDLNAQVLRELALPPIKRGRQTGELHVETLPVLGVEEATSYRSNPKEETALQKAIKRVQVNLWAISGQEPPADLKNLVMEVRREKKVNLQTMVDYYDKPADEVRFKANVENNQKDVAKVFAIVEGDYETLKELGEDLDKEPKRIQAHFLFLKARLEAQIAYLYEYQSALGSIRKELPALEKGHNGWRLASSAKPRGDRTGRQMEKEQKTDLKKLVDKYPGSPWAVLAQRDMLTSLGLEWQSAAKRE